MDEQALEEYADAYRAGDTLPPLDVFEVEAELVIVDGFHRHEAARRAKVATLPVRTVGKGSMADAEWHALGSNQKHGLRRTREDKRRAVWLALDLGDDRSNREIAKHIGVSHTFVANLRRVEQQSGLPPEWFDPNLVPLWAIEAAQRYSDPNFKPELGAAGPVEARRFVRLARLEWLASIGLLTELVWESVDAGWTLRDAELHAYELIVYANTGNVGMMEDLCAAMRHEFEPEILAEIDLSKKYGMDVWILRMYSAVIQAAQACPERYGDLAKLPTIGAAYQELQRRNPEWSGVGRPLPDVFPPGFRDKETWREYAVQWKPEAA
jgi:hypothetical protein